MRASPRSIRSSIMALAALSVAGLPYRPRDLEPLIVSGPQPEPFREPPTPETILPIIPAIAHHDERTRYQYLHGAIQKTDADIARIEAAKAKRARRQAAREMNRQKSQKKDRNQ